jgi:hypothetical protein
MIRALAVAFAIVALVYVTSHVFAIFYAIGVFVRLVLWG